MPGGDRSDKTSADYRPNDESKRSAENMGSYPHPGLQRPRVPVKTRRTDVPIVSFARLSKSVLKLSKPGMLRRGMVPRGPGSRSREPPSV